MTKTIKNLTAAFIGESQARNRYSIYAKIAKNEGFEKIMALFELTAEQEAEHAKWLMRLINELKGNDKNFDEIIVEASAPTIVSDTKTNLRAAIAGEHHEHTSMYPEFAKIAEEEGLAPIAVRLKAIALAEKNHEERYAAFLNELETDTIFQRKAPVEWQCRKCGYLQNSVQAPGICPSCGHPQAYFEVK